MQVQYNVSLHCINIIAPTSDTITAVSPLSLGTFNWLSCHGDWLSWPRPLPVDGLEMRAGLPVHV